MRKGDMVFWEISEFETTKEAIEAAGFRVPRNNYKSALIKALKILTKGNEKDYKRFNDKDDSVSFAIFARVITGDTIDMNKEIIVRLDKKTGVVHHTEGGVETAAAFTRICEVYGEQKLTINASQFRSVVTDAVREAYGVSVRSGGGVYYIDKRFDERRAKLQRLFDIFPGKAKLFSFPIHSDEGSLEVIENAASTDIFGEINTLIKEVNDAFRERKITKRQLEGARDRASSIVETIKVHEENLRGSLSKVSDELNRVRTALSGVFSKVEEGIVEPEDFMRMLKEL